MKSKQLNEEDLRGEYIDGNFYILLDDVNTEIRKIKLEATKEIQSAVMKEIDKLIDKKLITSNNLQFYPYHQCIQLDNFQDELKQNLNKNVFENGNKNN